jgi:hypothetical protein
MATDEQNESDKPLPLLRAEDIKTTADLRRWRSEHAARTAAALEAQAEAERRPAVSEPPSPPASSERAAGASSARGRGARVRPSDPE